MSSQTKTLIKIFFLALFLIPTLCFSQENKTQSETEGPRLKKFAEAEAFGEKYENKTLQSFPNGYYLVEKSFKEGVLTLKIFTGLLACNAKREGSFEIVGKTIKLKLSEGIPFMECAFPYLLIYEIEGLADSNYELEFEGPRF